ncbi:MAG: RdgB/HAM1 family non-canonical purine NTP pyrophosphatase [Rubrobacteraceae bacterium]|nr:RdgB/HAM1 family non-canonical purine NTP pyrophosphatase [Rubrobacter sp.]
MKPVLVTSNENKLREAAGILGVDLDRADVDVPEIQSLDFEEVAAAKALAAREALGEPSYPVIVDDSGLSVGAWGGFPGPLTRWLMKSVGNAGLLKMLAAEENRSALAVCVVAVTDASGSVRVFRGVVEGEISRESRGEGGFGFDPIFVPEGENRTYAEMEEEKSLDSHRARALRAARLGLETIG